MQLENLSSHIDMQTLAKPACDGQISTHFCDDSSSCFSVIAWTNTQTYNRRLNWSSHYPYCSCGQLV